MEKYHTAPDEQLDFSLVLGGPIYQLLLRAGMVQPSMGLLHRRIIAAAVIMSNSNAVVREMRLIVQQ